MDEIIMAQCPECNHECHILVCKKCNLEFDHPRFSEAKKMRKKLNEKQSKIIELERRLEAAEEVSQDIEKEVTEAAFKKGKLAGFKEHQSKMSEVVENYSEESFSKDKKITELKIEKSKLRNLLKQKNEAEISELEKSAETKAFKKYQKMLDEAEREHEIIQRAKDQELHSIKTKQKDLIKHGEVYSQELQGEAGQNYIENSLKGAYPNDEVIGIKKGVRGADFKHRIYNRGRYVATILVEVKNTINGFQKSWLPKLEDDLSNSDASIAVLVCHNLPEQTFKYAERGIFLTNYENLQGLMAILRILLLRESRIVKNNEHKREKAIAVFDVLTSEKFANQVRRLFDIYTSMLERVEKEYQFHTRSAAARKAELQNFGNFMMEFLGFLEGHGENDDFAHLSRSFEITDQSIGEAENG